MKGILRWASALLVAALLLMNLPMTPRAAAHVATTPSDCPVGTTADGRPVINPSGSGPGTGKRISFDNTHGSTAGQADWVIDGGFSDMACALAAIGYTVEEMRTYPLTTSAMLPYDVVVFAEPNIPFTTEEMSAIEAYVASGKGVLFVGDHYQADRNLNTWDAAEVFNGFRRGHYGQTYTSPAYNYNGVKVDTPYTFNQGSDWMATAFGLRFRYNAFDLAGANFHAGNAADPEDPGILPADRTFGITAGVSSVATYAGATLSIVDPTRAMGIVYPNKSSLKRWSNAQADDPAALYTDSVGAPAGGTVTFGGINEGAYVAIAKPNAGKVAAAGDSSLWEDGHPKYTREIDGAVKNTHDGWLDSDHDTLGINLVNWLATPDPTPGIDPALRQPATPEPLDPFTIGEPLPEPWNTPPASYKWYDACTFQPGAYIGTTVCTTPPPPPAGWRMTSVPANVYPGNRAAAYLEAGGLPPNSAQAHAAYWYVNGAGTQVSRRYNRATGTFEPGLTAQTLTTDALGSIRRWEFWEVDNASTARNLNLRIKVGSNNAYTSAPIPQAAASGTYGYLTVEQSLGYSNGLHAALFTRNGSLDTAVGIMSGADTTVTLPPGTYTLDMHDDSGLKRGGITVNITAGQTVSLAQILNPGPGQATWAWQNVPKNAYPGNTLAVFLDARGLTPGNTYSNQAYVYLTGGAQVSKRYNRTTGQFVDGLTAQDLTADAQGNIQRYEFWQLTQTANTTADYNVRVRVGGSNKDTKAVKQVATGSFGYLTIEQSLGYSDGLHAALFTANGVLDTAVGVYAGANTTVTLPAGTYTLELRNDAGIRRGGITVTITAGQTVSLNAILNPVQPSWTWEYVGANVYPGNKLAAFANIQNLPVNSAQTFDAYVYLTGGAQVSKRYNRTTGEWVSGTAPQTLTTDGNGRIQRWEIWEIIPTSNKTAAYNMRLRQNGQNKVTRVLNQVATGPFGYLTIGQSFGYDDGLHVALFTRAGALDTVVALNQGAGTTITLPAGTYTMEIRTDAGAVLSDITFTITEGVTSNLTAILDTTKPTITGVAAPAPNAEGWNSTDVTVTFTCADLESGVATCTDPITLTTEGAGQSVTGTAVDIAGNSATVTVSGINIDKTAPTIDVDGDRTYTADETVTLTCTAADNLSGLTSDPCAEPLVSAPAYTFAPGTHDVTVIATDKAGNTTTFKATFTVEVTYNSVAALIEQFVAQKGTANSLTAKLDTAAKAAEKGNLAARDGALEALRHELAAQSGQHVPAEAAAILDALVQALTN